eukprot:GILK01010710.1.p1 GENE.GILK01010710.1~~GILK01010710.1.p1  ORF type:complete len:279 (+),score=33.52 GILK01010710.1:39-875(+)
METALTGDEVSYFSHDFEYEDYKHTAKAQLDELPTNHVSASELDKIEEETEFCWEKFHKQNIGKFFKDRHYLSKVFPEVIHTAADAVLLEVGCGTGNTIFPFMDMNHRLFVHAFDFSPSAVDVLKQHPSYQPERCNAFVCNFVKDPLPPSVPLSSVDFCSMVFVLSALVPSSMSAALAHLWPTLRPGCLVLVRDYGRFDLAMLRSHRKGSQLDQDLYARGDGTLTYYFTIESLTELFTAQGFERVSCEYCTVQSINRKTGAKLNRVWVQGKFRKPLSS